MFYDPETADADSSCIFALPEYNCDGTCISNQDGDGICDGLENHQTFTSLKTDCGM